MAEFRTKLEITPRVVDLGDRVIQLHHVVSAGRHATHPFRAIGLLLIAAGVALIAGEAMMRGVTAFKLQSGGSLPLWIAFAVAGIGLFLALFARRLLVIRTSDGGRVVIPSADEESSAALILQLRHAMEGAGVAGGTAHAQAAPVLIGSSTPELTAVRSATVPLGLPQQSQPPMTRSAPAEQTTPHTVPAGRFNDGFANGHASRGSLGPGQATQGMSLAEATAQVQKWATASQQEMPGASAPAEQRRPVADAGRQLQTSRDGLSLPVTGPSATSRDDGPHDLALLMEHVRRADVQHKEALLDLLRVIEDYYKGRASRDDAVAHWRSFADYVVQYLGNVDGLTAYTERFGRHMLVR